MGNGFGKETCFVKQMEISRGAAVIVIYIERERKKRNGQQRSPFRDRKGKRGGSDAYFLNGSSKRVPLHGLHLTTQGTKGAGIFWR